MWYYDNIDKISKKPTNRVYSRDSIKTSFHAPRNSPSLTAAGFYIGVKIMDDVILRRYNELKRLFMQQGFYASLASLKARDCIREEAEFIIMKCYQEDRYADTAEQGEGKK